MYSVMFFMVKLVRHCNPLKQLTISLCSIAKLILPYLFNPAQVALHLVFQPIAQSLFESLFLLVIQPMVQINASKNG